mgnify:CR=1 FL=1
MERCAAAAARGSRIELPSEGSGGAGSGKSHVIRVVAKWLEFILRKPGDHPMKPKVLLLGFTGMAANLIGRRAFIYW